jgi:hypothetical protein
MRSDFDNRFNEINTKLSEVKTLEKTYNLILTGLIKLMRYGHQVKWKRQRMKYTEKKYIIAAAIAIITFVQIIIGIGISIWSHLWK